MDINQLLRNVAVPTHGMYGNPRTPEQIQEDELRMVGANLPGDLHTPTLTDEQLMAMMSPEAQAAYQAPTVEEIDALMHAARARAIGNQAPVQAPSGPSAADGYYIPEFTDKDFAAASAPTIAPEPAPDIRSPMEQKVKDLQDQWGSQGFKFHTDEKGRMVITNTPETRNELQGRAGLGDSYRQLPVNIKGTLEAIQASEDPIQRATMMADLAAEAERFKASIWQDTIKQAEARLGVPQIEQQLAEAEALDRRDPKWMQHQSDSPVTARVRNAYQSALAQAEGEAKRAVMGNVAVAGIDAQVKAAQAVYSRAETIQSQRDTFRINREYTNEARLQELIQTLGPKLDRVAIIEPELAGKSVEEQALYVAKGMKDKNALAALEAPIEDLPMHTLLGKNTYAQRLLAHEEAKRTNKDPALVDSQLKRMQQDMMNDKTVLQAARIVHGGDEVSMGAIAQSLQMARVGTAAQKEEALEMRFGLIMAREQRSWEEKFINNVEAWGLVDDKLKIAIDTAKSTTGTADAASVLGAYRGTAVGPEKTQLENEFFALMDKAALPYTRSLLGAIDPETIKHRLIQDMNTRSIWERLSALTTFVPNELTYGEAWQDLYNTGAIR